MRYIGIALLTVTLLPLEFVFKVIWCIIFSIFKPLIKAVFGKILFYHSMEEYAYDFKTGYNFCCKVYDLWDD